jgi:hypothetical protein
MADSWPKQRPKQRVKSEYRFGPVLVIAGYVLGSGIGRRMRKRVRAQINFEYPGQYQGPVHIHTMNRKLGMGTRYVRQWLKMYCKSLIQVKFFNNRGWLRRR